MPTWSGASPMNHKRGRARNRRAGCKLCKPSSAYSDKVVTALFRAAIFQTTKVIKDSGVNPKTARRLLTALKEDGLLVELEPASGSKPAIYLFPELFRISEGIDGGTSESI